ANERSPPFRDHRGQPSASGRLGSTVRGSGAAGVRVVAVTVADYESWRRAVRQLLARGTPPDDVGWLAESGQAALPFPVLETRGIDDGDGAIARRTLVPRSFQSLADLVSCHRSRHKWAALYRVLWRLVVEGRHVLEQASHEDVRIVNDLADQVR